MSNDDSVTLWIEGIKAGDGNRTSSGSGTATSSGWSGWPGRELPAHCRRAFDEEDVALSAFQSFCDRAGRGQFPQL